MMTIGVATINFDINKQVGSDASSWGFNISNGRLVHSGDSSKSYGRRVNEGETVAVFLDRAAGALRFFVNDEDNGVAFVDERLKTLKLFPVLSTGVVASAKFIEAAPAMKCVKKSGTN